MSTKKTSLHRAPERAGRAKRLCRMRRFDKDLHSVFRMGVGERKLTITPTDGESAGKILGDKQ